jgi:glycine/D-amino acid oxidase-like deaminating enzyme
MWSQQVAADCGAAVPLWPCEHEYVLTEAMPEAKNLPVVRSYDEYLYIKEDAGRVRCAFFDKHLHSRMPWVAGLKLWHACDVINVAAEFMVDVARVEARPCV